MVRPPRILLYVDAVARHGSIRKAAEVLHLASSALNRQILNLEEELGAALFERLPRGVRLTAAGEVFVGYVRRALSDLESAGNQIESLRGLVRGQVRITAAESLAGDLLPRAITQFQARHPKVRFHLTIGAPGDLQAALLADTTDLILTHELPAHRDVSVLASVPHPFCAVVARGHPLAARRSLRLRDCLAYPVALADQTLAGRGLIDRALAKASFQFEPALVSNSAEAMKAYARLSQGVSFQFRVGATRDVEVGDMVAIPLSDPTLSQPQLVLAARRGRVLPIAAAAFSEELQTALAALELWPE
jgi:DNA-binding transcriptional LysR family regulator